MPWRLYCFANNHPVEARRATRTSEPHQRRRALAACAPGPEQESKMPKLKTKSGAKKRFKMTGTGKVKAAAQGKRHGMIKRTAKFVQQARGTMVLNDSDAKIVKKYMPYDR
jgi:large subunit ribosomal protein L35